MHANNFELRTGPWTYIRRRILMCLYGLDAELYAEPDGFAFVIGWQTRRPGLFRRGYRDPRFDSFGICAVCAGTGDKSAPVEAAPKPPPCPACDGFGRVEKVPAQGGGRR